MSGAKQLTERMIHIHGLSIKTLNSKSGSQSEQRRVNSSTIRSKTTHGTQIVFGRRSGSASLKGQSPQKSTAKRTRLWRILSIIFFAVVGKSTNSKIESLAKENKFDLNNSIFTSRSFPTCEQFIFHSVKCKEVRDIINAIPSNKAPGIDKVPTRVIKDCLPIILPFVPSIINASLSSSGNQLKSLLVPGCFPVCQTDWSEISGIPRKMEQHFLIKPRQPIGVALATFDHFRIP